MNLLKRDLFSCCLAALLFVVSGSLSILHATDVEPQLVARALEAVSRYDRPQFYNYRPRSDASEHAASTVAIIGNILLEGYRIRGTERWLEHARIAADTLISHSDMNADGKVGWGRFWKLSGPSGDAIGGNTTFALDCTLPRNRAYDDELYDDARIAQFLLELYQSTDDARYLKSAQEVIENTWDVGEPTQGGAGFAYFKTIGPCDRGWHVKNINVLMAVSLAMLAKVTGDQRYWRRLEAVMMEERAQIRRTVDGRLAPNLGYLGVETMIKKPTKGGYVTRAQTKDLSTAIACNDATRTGESCTQHLGLEARSIDLVLRLTRRADLGSTSDVEIVMEGHLSLDAKLCSSDRVPYRSVNSTYCAAYQCALRRLRPEYANLCLKRTEDPASATPDVVLGLFWGRPGRFPPE